MSQVLFPAGTSATGFHYRVPDTLEAEFDPAKNLCSNCFEWCYAHYIKYAKIQGFSAPHFLYKDKIVEFLHIQENKG